MPLPPPVHAPTNAAVESVAVGNVNDAHHDPAVPHRGNLPAQLMETVKQVLHRLFGPAVTPLGIRCVLISDTHGCHRELVLPEGDVLVHAGDFTRSGLRDDAVDFNDWLGEQPHKHKIVVFGNHEYNAPWAKTDEAVSLLTNATLLRDTAVTIEVAAPRDGGSPRSLRVHGTQFCWPMRGSRNPAYDQVPADGPIDILVAHGPVLGYADGGKGCPELLRLAERLRPRLVVGGHIHFAHGVTSGRTIALSGTTFVNAANARDRHTHMGWRPEVVDV